MGFRRTSGPRRNSWAGTTRTTRPWWSRMVTADIESPLLGSLTSSLLGCRIIANPPPWFTQISSFEARAAFPVTPSEHSRKNTQ
jgi:hypothetical protein